MTTMIGIIPGLPVLSFLVIALFGRMLTQRQVATLAMGSVSLSAVLTILLGVRFLSTVPPGGNFTTTLYTWMHTGGFQADISFKLDALSLVFCFVITFVGALIHLYSVDFMKDDEGFARFFAYMNLFVGSMLILVLAGNLLLLYLGWEGVGLCSYLLIGFWYKDPANNFAARKAFIVTRIGDTFMIVGFFLLFFHFGTLDIDSLMDQASVTWSSGSPLATISATLLLLGALGKSAQLPLQTWLPDAMAGPSPVSALIHAATMVTAGVYLIARTHVLFSMAPMVQAAVAIIGAITLLIAGFSALVQHDLKRVLAYSTISQIGYMFLALGIGAWSAAIFHFMIHAFFKALLFLAAGSVILLLHEEHDMVKMGGLRKKLPVLFITFLIGGASLSALPFITAGFYSKDQILWLSWSSGMGSKWLWLAGITGALITSLYTFRMIFLTFFGELKIQPKHRPDWRMTLPLLLLALLSLLGGFIEIPENMGPVRLFSKLLDPLFPVSGLHKTTGSEWVFQFISAIVSIGGIMLAYRFFKRKSVTQANRRQHYIRDFLFQGWGFDWLYDRLFVRPAVWLAESDKNDFIDKFYSALADITGFFNGLLSKMQNGKLRRYAVVLTAGIVVLLVIMLIL
jgi:NADH-quinone oxidoreductase subunit L